MCAPGVLRDDPQTHSEHGLRSAPASPAHGRIPGQGGTVVGTDMAPPSLNQYSSDTHLALRGLNAGEQLILGAGPSFQNLLCGARFMAFSAPEGGTHANPQRPRGAAATPKCTSHTCEKQVPLRGFLPLLQTGVQQAEQLQHALLPPRLGQAGIVHDEVRVDLAVVAADVEPPGRGVVLLHDLHPGHKPTQAGTR